MTAANQETNPHISANILYSSLRERIVEHNFLGEILRTLWVSGAYTTEVSRSESDSFGYDIVIELGKIVRHVQLKSKMKRRPRRISVSSSLAKKPSACVICVMLNEDLSIKSFYWFGKAPGKNIGRLRRFKSSKTTRRNRKGQRTQRRNHVDIPIREFEKIDTAMELIQKLFGRQKVLRLS